MKKNEMKNYMLDVDPTWEEMEEMSLGNLTTIIGDHKEGDFRVIMKVHMSIVAYIGIKKELLSKAFKEYPNYDHISNTTDIYPHGGFTYNGTFANQPEDDTFEDYYYYGWDYGHSGDAMLYDNHLAKTIGSIRALPSEHNHKWLPHEVREEAFNIMDQFKSFLEKWST